MKKTLLFALFSASLGALPLSAEVDCLKLAISVKAAVANDQAKVLEVVAAEVSAAPSCACEVVKAAIEASAASTETVAAIVETAITAAPDQMRMIAQCAIAVAPDAFAQVQAVMAKFDPNSGETGYSDKGAKSGKSPAGEVAAMPNPLDFPGQGPVGPTPGGPGGSPILPPMPPVIINPPEVTPG